MAGAIFVNKITRLSDHPVVEINFPYPKTPSWNNDGSFLMLTNRLLDGRTYQTILTNRKKYPDNPNGDFQYAIDQYAVHLNSIREIAHQGQHGDIGIQTNGMDMNIQFEFGSRRGIWGYDLESDQETQQLPDKYKGGHVSCRDYGRPGWCNLSTAAYTTVAPMDAASFVIRGCHRFPWPMFLQAITGKTP